MRRRCQALSLLLACSACGPTATQERDASANSDLDAAPLAIADASTVSPPSVEPSGSCAKLDILFVIDRSSSMAHEKANLLANFPTFIAALDDGTNLGSELDYRVAVIDDTMSHLLNNFAADHWKEGHDGVLHAPKHCALPRPWVERGDYDRAEAFGCIADVELDDTISTYEMPLGALVRSLEPTVPGVAAEEFIRSDALLGVVILTDEDDHSANEVPWQEAEDGCPVEPKNYTMSLSDVAAALDRAKGGREHWALAVMAGTGPGDCQSEFGTACEARRLKRLAKLAGSQGNTHSICEGDLTPAIDQALRSFRAACGRIID